jgi:hypothetical protein
MIKKNLQQNGYYIFPNSYTLLQIENVLNELNQMDTRRTPLNEKNQSVWWDEISIPNSSYAASLILDNDIKLQIESEFSKIRDAVFWANRYKSGEYIPKHRDTQGDLQIILPVFLPPQNCGGNLLIHHSNNTRTIYQTIGQRLLFRAIKTPHETTRIINSPECAESMRIVCICRIFFS